MKSPSHKCFLCVQSLVCGHCLVDTIGQVAGPIFYCCFIVLWALCRKLVLGAKEHVSGLLTHSAHWVGCGSHVTIVLLFGGVSRVSVARFCC